jgi:hypothetical protein
MHNDHTKHTGMLRKKFRQVLLPDASLQRGLFGISDVPGHIVAILAATPGDFTKKFGVVFQATFDNLDDLIIAVFEFDEDSSRFSLQRHNGLPKGETEVTVSALIGDHAALLARIFEALGMEERDILWIQS